MIDLQVTQVTVNDDGTFNVYVQVYDDVKQKVLVKKTVTASSKEDLKNKVRPHWIAFKEYYDQQQLYLTVANQAMDELEAEE